MKYPGISKKNHLNLPGLIKKEVKLPGMIKKKKSGKFQGFWHWSFPFFCNFQELIFVLSAVSKDKVTNLKIPVLFFSKKYVLTFSTLRLLRFFGVA